MRFSLEIALSDGRNSVFSDGTRMTAQQLYLKSISLDPAHAFVYSHLAVTLPAGRSVTLLDGTRMTQQELQEKHISNNISKILVR